MKPFLAIFVLLCAILPAGASLAADEDPFEKLADTSVSFFQPMEGTVTAVSNGTIISDLGKDAGIREGMRLDITRKGTPFVHPITKEKLGLMETPVGRAEVVEAGPDFSKLRVLRGEPAAGDLLRISSALVRTLFFQSSEVDWNVSEEYYEKLRNTDRFHLIDVAPGAAPDSVIVEEARNLGAQIVLVLTSEKTDGDLTLKQRLLWAEDANEFSIETAKVDAELLADLRLGSELFTPAREYVITFDISYNTSIVEAGDIDGDGVKELILGTDTTLSFLKTDGPLNPALGGLEYKGPSSEEIIWLDVYDLDGDGKDELAITSKRSSAIVSRLYRYKDGGLVKELEGNHFLRVFDGRLYGQKFDKDKGYSGPLFSVRWSAVKETSSAPAINLPPGINIYDFSSIENPEGERWMVAFDDSGYLNLYDEKGMRTWRSTKDYGEGVNSFKKESRRTTVDVRSTDSSAASYSMKEWVVNDKIHVMGRSALVTDRVPVSSKAPGLGIKGSQIIGLRWIGPSFQENPVFKDISGNVRDFAIIGDRVYILARPSGGFDIKKLLKGKNPLINKLYVYSLKGI